MRPAEERRPDPDALMAAHGRQARAPLKLFLGAAPGVGKTFAMLGQARRLAAEGRTDIVAGLIETHGRRETEAQIGDLPVLPRRLLAYGGRMLEEFDLEAALARRPGLLLLDELAHRNVPGSRHRRRWEDVVALLDAGIPVWSTLNIQHLESLNDAVLRITGVRVAETVPDHVLELADEIELVDLPPADLRTRLAQGRVYRGEQATRALAGFFREGNLHALRELALRRTAQHVDAGLRDYMRLNAIAGPWPATERLLALIGPEAGETVVREAKRLADALHAPWIALHVEPGDEDPLVSQRVAAALALATELGAETDIRAPETLPGGIVATALAVAHGRNASQIVVGRRATGNKLRRLTLRRADLAAALAARATDHAVHIVPTRRRTPPVRRRPRLRQALPAEARWLLAVLAVAAVVGLGEALPELLDAHVLGLLFLPVVVGAAALFGLGAAMLSARLSFLSWNYFFLPPLYRFTIADPRSIVALFVFLLVAALTGGMASRLRNAARAAQGRIEGLRRIGAFSRALGGPVTEAALQEEIVRQAASIVGRALFLSERPGDSTLDIRAAEPAADTMDEGSWAAAAWAWRHAEPTGRGTNTLPSAPWRFLPIRLATADAAEGLRGLLAVRTDGAPDAPALQAVQALADQAAVALERVRLLRGAAEAAARDETQVLRTALLNSLSHDLRTPLTAIRGAAETLRTVWADLPEASRADLLASIEDDTMRMTRFLANITDMTRLESGAIVPRLQPVLAFDVLQDVVRRVSDRERIRLFGADSMATIQADPVLLGQLLFNVLDNALKYAPEGSAVVAEVLEDAGSVVLRIADEGPGIAADALPHVFDSFFRARQGDRVVPGTGLGLAIARGFANVMGADIRIASPVPGRLSGTEVRILFGRSR